MNYEKIVRNLDKEINLKQTYRLLETLSSNGDLLAKAILGAEYFNDGYKKLNDKTALRWIEDFLANSVVSPRWTLFYEIAGWAYFNGLGTRKNYKKSFKLHSLGAKNRPESMYYLADFYFEGIGMRKNYKKAYYWYLKAGKLLKVPDIPLRLGYMNVYGLGMKKDRGSARKYYRKSMKLGSKDAKYNLILMDIEDKKINNQTLNMANDLIASNYKKKGVLKRRLGLR